MPLAPGTQVGPYKILSRIGAGGMGEVWKAHDPRLNRTVAIKTAQEHFSDRFEREARAIAALNHPHICQLYDVGPDYLAMEYIEGQPRAGPLPLGRVLEYATQICAALDAAHRKRIAHRDLKPGGKSGIKVLDFGLARTDVMSGASGGDVQKGVANRAKAPIKVAETLARLHLWTGSRLGILSEIGILQQLRRAAPLQSLFCAFHHS